MLTHIYQNNDSKSHVTLSNMSDALGWTDDYSKKVCKFAYEEEFIKNDDYENLVLTKNGCKKAEQYASK